MIIYCETCDEETSEIEIETEVVTTEYFKLVNGVFVPNEFLISSVAKNKVYQCGKCGTPIKEEDISRIVFLETDNKEANDDKENRHGCKVGL
jgi:hypothetical protein